MHNGPCRQSVGAVLVVVSSLVFLLGVDVALYAVLCAVLCAVLLGILCWLAGFYY